MSPDTLGRFCWHDLMTTDVERSQAFYESLFGWTLNDQAAPNGYREWRNGSTAFGGVVPWPPDQGPMAAWAGYVVVADCEIAANRVRELGGNVSMEPTSLGDTGVFAPVIDNRGADFVLFQPGIGSPLAGLGSGGLGDVVLWNELITDDLQQSVDFYTELLGWSVDQAVVDARGYVIARQNGVPAAGLFQPGPAPASAGWVTSFATDDINGIASNASELGGTIAHAVQDVPGIGRTGWIQDPLGALFGLMQPVEGWYEHL